MSDSPDRFVIAGTPLFMLLPIMIAADIRMARSGRFVPAMTVGLVGVIFGLAVIALELILGGLDYRVFGVGSFAIAVSFALLWRVRSVRRRLAEPPSR